MWTATFWKDTAERVISTIAQVALVTIGAEAFNVIEADWAAIAAVSVGGGVVALLKAVAASGIGDHTPSLVNTNEPKHRAG
ncbi:hypothetical protein GCM10022377_10360 [Zhihengliuella alba]|uniref:Holin n=1 Tax=Zhihengliuella alba TaxID=547018 RepID=A0ABP7D0W9_9MICC